MKEWLEKALKKSTLSEEARMYLLGRGARSSDIERLGLVTWDSSLIDEECPDKEFEDRYGENGSRFNDSIIIPCYSPSGKLIGFEGRFFQKERKVKAKALKHYLKPAKWVPIWVGIQGATEKIDAGANIWIVEGIFDLFALSWVVPETDVILSTEGASCTWSRVKYLARWSRGVIHLVYDNDETGRNAIEGWVDEGGTRKKGALELLAKAGLHNVVDIRYQGKDPGQIWTDYGREGLERMFSHASF